ncbi:MAG: ABC transporter substrate-binding protein [Xanthobacteraceae bacterium]|jgi:NitT/TauT family transport system substrate-binding protein
MSRHPAARSPLSRRLLLKNAALAAGAFTLPAAPFVARAATALRPVSMTLDWIYQGPNVGFIMARDKGFYRDAGLDVTVTSGKGSGTTAQLIASKASQFGFSDGYGVATAISKGMPIKTIGSVFRKNPAALIVLADSGITTPKDLEGKTVAMTAGSGQFQQWPAFATGAGIDVTKIRMVNIDPAGVGPALVSKKADAIGGYAQGYVPAIEIRAKKEVRIFWFADYGVHVVSNGIIVHNDLLKSDPDLVRTFVAPSIKGFLYGRQHPDEAVASVKRYLPTVDPAIARRELELSWKTWVTPTTKDKPLGWEAESDWTSTVQVLKQYGGVSTPPALSALYTNEFVPTGAEYVPPQTA